MKIEKRVATKVLGTIESLSGTTGHLDYKRKILDTCRRIVEDRYSFQQVEIPILEQENLYLRTVGTDSDIVNKELFRVKRINAKPENEARSQIVLRPEGTAGVVRALLSSETKWAFHSMPFKAWYHGPMFRGERPQRGRFIQFDQLGIESLSYGKDSILTDVESIEMGYHIFKELGFENKIQIQINSLGSSNCLSDYNEALKKALHSRIDELSDYTKARLNGGNIVRLLDSKLEEEQNIIKDLPLISEFYDDNSKRRFENVCNHLSRMRIPFVLQPRLVRGLDYYNDTVFEFTHLREDQSQQSALLAGGRYDSLPGSLATFNAEIQAFGWALGLDRLAHEMLLEGKDDDQNNERNSILLLVLRHKKAREDLAVIQDELVLQASSLLRHKCHLNVRIEIITGSAYQALLEKSKKFPEFQTAVIVGPSEAEEGTITIKPLKSKDQMRMKMEEMVEYFQRHCIGNEQLNKANC